MNRVQKVIAKVLFGSEAVNKGLYYNDRLYYGGGIPFFQDGLASFFKAPNVLSLYDFQSIENAYYRCSTIQGIITDKAQYANNGIVKIVTLDDKPARGSFAREVLKRMENPNCFQTYDMFRAESKIYLSMYGYHAVWYIPNVLGQFVNIWNLNPSRTRIVYKGVYLNQTKLEDIIESITYYSQGKEYKIPVEQVVFVKDTVPTRAEDQGTAPPMLPTSRLIGLSLQIKNNIGAIESRNSILTSRGAEGVISNASRDASGSIPMLDEEKKELQLQYGNDYGTMPGQSKVIFSKNDVRFTPFTRPTRELMLLEESDSTKLEIAGCLGWPKELLNFLNGPTFDNQERAEKRAYQATIIPEDISEIPQLWKGWKLEEQGLKVVTDFSHVEVLKDDERENEKIRRDRLANIISINQMTIPYENKLRIAVNLFEIDIEEAKELISETNEQPSKETDPAANTGAGEGN